MGKSDDIETRFDIYCMEMQCPKRECGFSIIPFVVHFLVKSLEVTELLFNFAAEKN